MKLAFSLIPLLTAIYLPSCRHTVRPEDSIIIAKSYADLQWQPEARHIRHGHDSKGIMVNTPDTSLPKTLGRRGYWTPGRPATGMPYKWGGFDTPESFLKGIAAGKKAGDVVTDEKVTLNDDAISRESVGIDCSGFVSRCWKLPAHVSTPHLPELCDPIEWEDVQAGDMLLRPGHAVLVHYKDVESVHVYEAASIPTSKVVRRRISFAALKDSVYQPYRYRFMAEPLGEISDDPTSSFHRHEGRF
ncbi:MAG: hypothetical protein ABJQ29_11440 [Luteolibacter sp.]